MAVTKTHPIKSVSYTHLDVYKRQAVGAHQPDDFMLADGKAHAGENGSIFSTVCIAHIRN